MPSTPDLFPYFLAWRAKHGPFDGEFFLDSFRAKGQARYSYFPLSPPEKIFSASSPGQFPKAWNALQKEIAQGPRRKRKPDDPPFTGGAVGILSYDAGRFFEPGWRTAPPPDPLKFPLMWFGIYRDIACMDHRTGRIHISGKFSGIKLEPIRRFGWEAPAAGGRETTERFPSKVRP